MTSEVRLEDLVVKHRYIDPLGQNSIKQVQIKAYVWSVLSCLRKHAEFH